jgi:hypothetical protein
MNRRPCRRSASSAATWEKVGASTTVSLRIPLSCWMNSGIGRCGLTRVLHVETPRVNHEARSGARQSEPLRDLFSLVADHPDKRIPGGVEEISVLFMRVLDNTGVGKYCSAKNRVFDGNLSSTTYYPIDQSADFCGGQGIHSWAAGETGGEMSWKMSLWSLERQAGWVNRWWPGWQRRAGDWS